MTQRVTVIVPSPPQTRTAYSHYPGREEWPGCEGAIVDGGALEIRLVDQNGDYDVVRGYGPTGYLSFVNESVEVDEQAVSDTLEREQA